MSYPNQGAAGTSGYELSIDEMTDVENELRIRYAQDLTFSRVFGTRNIPEGTAVRRIKMITEMGPAHMVAEGSVFPVGEISRIPVDMYVDKMGLEVQLTFEEIAAARDAGIPIDQMNFIEQSRQVSILNESNLANAIRAVANANSQTSKIINLTNSGKKAWSDAAATPYHDVGVVMEIFKQNKTPCDVVLYGPGVEPYLNKKDIADGSTLGEDLIRRYHLVPIYAEGLENGEMMFANSADIKVEIASPFRPDGPYWKEEGQYWRWIVWTRNVPYINSYRSVYFLDVLSTT